MQEVTHSLLLRSSSEGESPALLLRIVHVLYTYIGANETYYFTMLYVQANPVRMRNLEMHSIRANFVFVTL